MDRMPPIYQTLRARRIVRAVGGVAFAIAALSLWALWPPNPHREWLRTIAAFWAVGPPIWFFVEYAWVFDNWGDEKAVARFKDLQGHASKIWGGILALLTASYFLGSV